MSVFSAAFVRYASERAVKTFAQVVIALLGAGTADLLSVNWPAILAVAAVSAAVSLLTSANAWGGTTPASDAPATPPAEVEPDPVAAKTA